MTIDMYFHDKERKEMLMVQHNCVSSSHQLDIAANLEEYVSSREQIPEDIARALISTLNTNMMAFYAQQRQLRGDQNVPDKATAAKNMRDAIAQKASITYTQADLPEDVAYVSGWANELPEETKPRKSLFGKLAGGIAGLF